jgi:hypothetical protein
VTSGGIARAGFGAPGRRTILKRTSPMRPPGALEVSVVMPCLNEAETVGACIEKASRAMRDHGIV